MGADAKKQDHDQIVGTVRGSDDRCGSLLALSRVCDHSSIGAGTHTCQGRDPGRGSDVDATPVERSHGPTVNAVAIHGRHRPAFGTTTLEHPGGAGNPGRIVPRGWGHAVHAH